MADDMSGVADSGHCIFISFSSRDRRTAKLVCKELEKRGLPCWISSRDVRPGENYQAAIARAIKSTQVVVLLFSTFANDSDEIKKEISLASQFKAAVIPVRVEAVSMDEAFSYELATRQWIDAYKGWEEALENLAQSAHAYIRIRNGGTATGGDVRATGARPRAINPERLRELEQRSAHGIPAPVTAPAGTDRPSPVPIVEPAHPAAPKLPAIASQQPAGIPIEGQDAIQAALATYLGPMARVLVRKYAADATSLADLVEKISMQIPSPEARSAFKRDCGPGLGRGSR